MKMLKISVVKIWLCVTGVAVVSAYCICTHRPNTPAERKRAEKIAERISKHGTISEYKSAGRHSSAVKKTTTAKVVVKDVKIPVYIPNPIFPPFTNALAELTGKIAEMAKDGDVELKNGFALTLKDGKPLLVYPDAYTNVVIGGIGFGGVAKGGEFGVSRKKIEGTDQQQMDGIGLSKRKRLDEPEFYCTDVTYSMLPATEQVDSIRMHGDLEVGNTSKAQEMMEEISGWMTRDYGATELDAKTPAGTLALKKFKIGDGMDVEVKVEWKRQKTAEGSDAHVDISFTNKDLDEENTYQRHELGQATDEARVNTLDTTGINYFSVKPRVDQDAVAKKVVY